MLVSAVYDATVEEGNVISAFLLLMSINILFAIIASAFIVIEVIHIHYVHLAKAVTHCCVFTRYVESKCISVCVGVFDVIEFAQLCTSMLAFNKIIHVDILLLCVFL